MIEISKNPNGDTRTAPKGITFEKFQEANDMHIDDVGSVMYELSRMVDLAGEHHDCTKKSQERMFYRDFVYSNSSACLVISICVPFSSLVQTVTYLLSPLIISPSLISILSSLKL